MTTLLLRIRFIRMINIKLIKKFRLLCRTRSRIRQALQGKMKPSFIINLLGIDVETYQKWIEWQMTPQMNWTNFELDHVKPIWMFDLSKDEELREAFNWRNTQHFFEKNSSEKGY